MKSHRGAVAVEGNRYGRLLAIKPTCRREKSNGSIVWEFMCDCGNSCERSVSRVTGGQFASCGCGFTGPKLGRTVEEAYFRLAFDLYKRNAAKRSLEFSLTLGEFISISKRRCEYCGGSELRKRKGYSARAVGVDRRDNDNGYSKRNCVPCCRTCNLAKRDMSYTEFNKWIKRLVAFHASSV